MLRGRGARAGFRHRSCPGKEDARSDVPWSPRRRPAPPMYAEAEATHPEIRPGLDALRTLPTLCQIEEDWGRIELKLETPDTRYWLTTQGLTRKSRQAPVNYVVDYVTVEKRSGEGRWDLNAVFSPEAWRLSQAFD